MNKDESHSITLLGSPAERFALESATRIDPFKTCTNIVYRITNVIEHKTYIGIAKRTFVHRYRGGNWWKHTHNRHLKEDFQRLGKEAFTTEIFEYNVKTEDLREIEAMLIRSHNSLYPHGYNKVSRSGKIRETSEDTRKKMSLSGKARIERDGIPFKGKTHSEETKRILREQNLGKHLSEETKDKIRANAPRGENHVHYGKPMPQHTRDALREGKEKQPTVPVLQIEAITQQVLREFANIKTASIQTGICAQNISRSCHSKHLKAGGYIWRHK